MQFVICALLVVQHVIGQSLNNVPKIPTQLIDIELDKLIGNTSNEIDANSADDDILPPVPKEMWIVPEMIRYHGYPVEVHNVTTTDGYILELHRIPNSFISNSTQRKRPVLLVHGYADTSATWVMIGPNRSIAYLLADRGHDVWLANTRGNTYSRRHIRINPDGSKRERYRFWNFSFHQLGMDDLPSMIDYILSVNKDFAKIHYIGHSQGTTAFFVMASERPEYNTKIQLMQAFAPVAFMNHVENFFVHPAATYLDSLNSLAPDITKFEFLPRSPIFTKTGYNLCRIKQFTKTLCTSMVFTLAGDNPDLFDEDLVPLLFKHIPAGASSLQMIHYGQTKKWGRFAQFDYGFMENLRRYGYVDPPDYRLHNVTVPIILHYSLNDRLAAKVDVLKLHSKLRNAHLKEVKHPKFNHADFVWAKTVETLLYNDVLDLFNRSDAGENVTVS